jgi:hypothetical protein
MPNWRFKDEMHGEVYFKARIEIPELEIEKLKKNLLTGRLGRISLIYNNSN